MRVVTLSGKLMKAVWRIAQIAVAVMALAALAVSQQSKGPEYEAYAPAQVAADILRNVANADGAFLPAGMLDTANFQADNLAKMVSFPTDSVVVVTLSGTQIKQAFERSLSLYPQPYKGFLQISGFDVTFNPEAAANQRVKSVLAGGLPLEDSKNYQVAMPVGLARGGYGYFKIWNESKITSTVPDMTVEKALAGKKSSASAPRWVAQSSF